MAKKTWRFFRDSKTQKLKILKFWDFKILNFYNRREALGIAAASFWSVAEKDIAESPTRSGTPKSINN